MAQRSLALFALLTLLTGGLLFWQKGAASRPLPGPAQAKNAAADTAPGLKYSVAKGSTPGQLTILDKKGQVKGNCPLKHTDVNVDIAGYVSRVTVTQEFQNTTAGTIEALYTFPLPSEAAVDDMTMHIGKRVVKSRILRREEAKEVYESAKSAGQATALLDQERPNIFTQSVANILPGDTVQIVIRYVNLLNYKDGWYEMVFPMVVGPRYIPNGGGNSAPGIRGVSNPVAQIPGDPGSTPVVTDAEKITPPITPPGTRAGHDISLTVHLDAGIPLQDVRSTLHPIMMEKAGPNRAVIRLKNQSEIPNKDFVLRYTAAGSEVVSGMLIYARQSKEPANHYGTPTNGYFTLIVQPPPAPPRERITPKEMIFVIDQTGSQGGWPIAKAKETMRHCIQNLNPGDTFQLIGFNTELYPCFPAPVPAGEQTIAQALKFLEPIEGNGGTDILKSVDYALKLPDDPNRLRIVCYMTDGYVGNDMQILDWIQKNRGHARMFPFGVGNSVNRFLIDGMAREGRGVAEYVTVNTNAGAQMGGDMPSEGVRNAKDAADRFYHRVADPLLLDISVDWNGAPVEDVYPKHIPDVFSSQPIVLKGRYTRAGLHDITIHGLLRGKPWSQTLRVVFPAVKDDGSEIMTLWARERIEDLQNQDWLGAQTHATEPAKVPIKEQLINTALEYRLLSQYTSFVAVEERVINAGGQQRTLDVPVELPEGVSYEGILGANGQLAEEPGLQRGRGGVAAGRTHFSLGYSFGGSAAAGGKPGAKHKEAKTASPGPSGAKGYSGMAGGGSGGPGSLGSLAKEPKEKQAAKKELKDGSATKLLPPGVGNNAVTALPADNSFIVNLFDGLAEDKPAALKQLAALKPEQRKAVLEQIKLVSGLQGLAEKVKKEGTNGSLKKPGLPEVVNGVVEVQIRLNSLPPNGLKQLKALGFETEATLEPGKLLLGKIAVSKLDALIELGFVRRVELPRFQ